MYSLYYYSSCYITSVRFLYILQISYLDHYQPLDIAENPLLCPMMDQRLAIITVYDVNPSHSKEILTVTDQLNKLILNTT
jgi:hypothetical protein